MPNSNMAPRVTEDRRPAGIMFHHFHGQCHPAGPGAISADDLEAIIQFVGHERILPAGEWLARTEAGTLAEGDLCLTFDDNLLCQYEVALPVIERHDITAFWFVYTAVNQGKPVRLEIYRYFRTTCFRDMETFYEALFQFLMDHGHADTARQALEDYQPERYFRNSPYLTPNDKRYRYVRDDLLGPVEFETVMDSMIEASGENLKDLSDHLWLSDHQVRHLHDSGHVVGLHSHTHPTTLAALSPEDQAAEYRDNFDHLERITGQTPQSMSHPSNSYNQNTIEILDGMGIRVGFRANAALDDYGPLELPRHNHATVCSEMRDRG